MHNDQTPFFAISVFFARNDAVFSVVSYEISFQRKNDPDCSKNGIENCVCSDKTIKLHFFVKKHQSLAKSMKCKILLVSIEILGADLCLIKLLDLASQGY